MLKLRRLRRYLMPLSYGPENCHCRAKEKLTLKNAAITRRLVAAAAAYISVLMRGRVSVELKENTVIVKPIAGAQVSFYYGVENWFGSHYFACWAN